MPVKETTANLVAGRTCEGCALCCKLYEIPMLPKPVQTWCPHCAGQQTCSIYDARPQQCRDFFCHYRLDAAVPEHWKPSLSHMALRSDPTGIRILVDVDSDYPDIWKSEPYYSDLKKWSANRLKAGFQVFVQVGGRSIAILPDRDEDLGEVGDRVILWEWKWTMESGSTLHVTVVDRDDPRASRQPVA